MSLAAKPTFRSFGSIFATSKTITFAIRFRFSTKRSFGSTSVQFTTRDRKRHDFLESIYYTNIFLASSVRSNSKPIPDKSFVTYLQENPHVSSYLRKESKVRGFATFPKYISPILQK